MGTLTADMEHARRFVVRLAEIGGEWSTLILEIAEGDPVADNVAVHVVCRLQASESLRPFELRESIAVTSGGMTKLVDRLEGAGLVARLATKPREDGRGVQIALTKKGSSLVQELLVAIAPRVHELNADLAQIVVDVDAEYSQRGSSDFGKG